MGDALTNLADTVLPGAITGLVVTRGPVALDDLVIETSPIGILYGAVGATTQQVDRQEERETVVILEITQDVTEDNAFQWRDDIDTYVAANPTARQLGGSVRWWFVAATELFANADGVAAADKAVRTLRMALSMEEAEP